MVRAAWTPDCIATSATPGRSFAVRHEVAHDEHLGMGGE